MRVEEKQKPLCSTFLLSFLQVVTLGLIYKSITHTCTRVKRKREPYLNKCMVAVLGSASKREKVGMFRGFQLIKMPPVTQNA